MTGKNIRYRVFQLDMWRDEDGWFENDRFELGVLTVRLPAGGDPDEKTILAAMSGFEVTDIAGRTFPALNTTDPDRVWAEDLYSDGEWWEVGVVKGRHPVFGLQLLEEKEERTC